MPGRVFLTSPLSAVAEHLGVALGDIELDPPRRNIAPGEQIAALTKGGFQHFRWGVIPVGRVNARGRPVMETIVNARSETVFDKSAFDGVGRAVVPVNGWYEWTGEKRRKTAWEITHTTSEFLFFAAITDVWIAPGGLEVPQLATVTCAPNKDVADIHHRMAVILETDQIDTWLNAEDDVARDLMRPFPDGNLSIQQANASWFA